MQSPRALSGYRTFTSATSDIDFRDTYQNYRESASASASGSAGYQVVTAATLVCNWVRTPNYDEWNEPVGQSKEDNIFTANNFNCGYLDDIQSGDYVSVLDLRGQPDWGIVKGAPWRDSITNRQYAHVVPTNPPTIVEGTWGS